MSDQPNSSEQTHSLISGDSTGNPSQDAPLAIPKNGRIHPSMMPLERTINILIVDDSFIVRSGLKASLSSQAGFNVVDEATSGREALEKADQHKPDVILMDIRMPDIDGIDATRQLLEKHPEARVIMLTWSENGQNLLAAVKVGAKGYLVHGSFTGEELRNAIQAVADGGALISPYLAPLLLDAFRLTTRSTVVDGHEIISSLTPREQDILALIREKYTNKEIATKLGIAEKTVKNYISTIYSKLMVSDRASAARFPFKAD
jgi:DNA-binding NarL/FixJ family response regulator